MRNNNFVNDAEKITDLFLLSKDQFLNSYSYLTDAEYYNTVCIIYCTSICIEDIDADDIKLVNAKEISDLDDFERSGCITAISQDEPVCFGKTVFTPVQLCDTFVSIEQINIRCHTEPYDGRHGLEGFDAGSQYTATIGAVNGLRKYNIHGLHGDRKIVGPTIFKQYFEEA